MWTIATLPAAQDQSGVQPVLLGRIKGPLKKKVEEHVGWLPAGGADTYEDTYDGVIKISV